MLLDLEVRNAIKVAFDTGELKVQAVGQDSVIDWRPMSAVLKHCTPHKKILRITTESGRRVEATEDHSLFMFEGGQLRETRTEHLEAYQPLAIVVDGELRGDTILSIEVVDVQPWTYDLSVPGPENFVLSNGIVAHNSYSIGGVSLDLEKSSKYESAYQALSDQFDKQLDRAKATVKYVRGLQQPKYGVGIRSSFGPYTSGHGTISPRKFVGI